jgi:galactose-6-phosphate isomerase
MKSKKIVLVYLEKYNELVNSIDTTFSKEHKIEKISCKNAIEYLKEIEKSSREVIDKKFDYIIGIDETGAKGFIVSTKVKKMVVAQINDEHSSLMTKDHNGSVGLMIGGEIITISKAIRIIDIFIKKEFSAGRHMVRHDMLSKLA